MMRTIATCIGFILLCTTPWYIAWIFFFAVAFYIPRYYELVFFGFVADLLYGQQFGVSVFLWTLITGFYSIALILMRTRIRV